MFKTSISPASYSVPVIIRKVYITKRFYHFFGKQEPKNGSSLNNNILNKLRR